MALGQALLSMFDAALAIGAVLGSLPAASWPEEQEVIRAAVAAVAAAKTAVRRLLMVGSLGAGQAKCSEALLFFSVESRLISAQSPKDSRCLKYWEWPEYPELK